MEAWQVLVALVAIGFVAFGILYTRRKRHNAKPPVVGAPGPRGDGTEIQ
jgi:hypothetical protein